MTHNTTNFASLLFGSTSRRAVMPGDQRGFTFLELMLVMTILSVLTLLAIPAYNGVQKTAKTARAETEIRDIEKSIQSFAIDNGRFPDSLDDVSRGDSADPWGRRYQYTNIAAGGVARIGFPETHDKLNSDFDLYSLGEDGLFEISDITDPKNADDIFRAGEGSFVGTVEMY